MMSVEHERAPMAELNVHPSAKASAPSTAEQEEQSSNHSLPASTPPSRPSREVLTMSVLDMKMEAADPKPRVPPDGGLEAWLVVAGCWCALFVTFGWLNCIGVFQDYYQQNLLKEYSSSTVAWISSTQTCLMFAGGLLFGKLFDSYGPRYELLIGSFLHVFGLMMTSISTQYYQIFLAQGVCSAAGASCIYYACAGSISTWFVKRRSTAFGIAASGSSVGGVLIPIMVFRLLPIVGFPWTMRIVAFLILGLLVVTIVTVKSMLSHTPKPFTVSEYILPLKEPPFALLVAAMTIFSFGLFLPFNYLIIQAQAEGMSINLSQYMVPILNAASVFGRTLPGIAADRYGRFNVMALMMACSSITVLAIWLPSRGNIPIIIFAVAYGFCSGAYVSLGPTLIAQISAIREIGLRNGTLYFMVSIAALAGNPIAGALIAAEEGGFEHMQIFAGVLLLAGAVLMAGSRVSQEGLKWKVI